jgi:hypothetical protein
MGEFKAYPKIHRLGKEETDGITDTPYTVQEKVDGANISIWLDDGIVKCGTRTRELPKAESFNGFQECVNANHLIKEFLESADSGLRLYGEWLVKHTITYPDEAYRKIYLFDVYDDNDRTFWPQEDVKRLANMIGLEYPHIFAKDVQLTTDELKEIVGKSAIGVQGEGVVLKNDFVNKFGDHIYAKVVHEKFKEANAIVFGGNNKNADSYWEMYIVNKYATLGRVQKIVQKLQSSTDHRLDMKETPMVAGSCYHDMITEEAWDIFKKVPVVDTKRLQRLAYKKFIQLYHDMLNNSFSVADQRAEIEECAS